jgi:peptide/nickel transport system ATP-binding protein
MGTKVQALQKTADILERVGLKADMVQGLLHEFSQGQRLRICIARALMLDAKIIVAVSLSTRRFDQGAGVSDA